MPLPVRYGHPLLLLLLGMLPLDGRAEDLFLEDSQPLPEVLTATRLQQAPAAIPGSISIIDRELIRASGARDIPELLRLVPGMLVVPNGNGATTTLNYHGSNADQARRLQVLVDGRSVYRPGFAQIDWNDIPLSVMDIERIEVFRGPNTVSYGANALMAVVSIITRQPKDTLGTHLALRAGNRGVLDWYASHSDHWQDGDYRLSLSGLHDDGFDQQADGRTLRDGRQLTRLNLHLDRNLDDGGSLEWQLALKDGVNQVNNRISSTMPIDETDLDRSDDSDITARDYATSLRWQQDLSPSHSLQVQGSLQRWERLRSWRACEASLAFSPQLYRMWDISPQWTSSFLLALETGSGIPASTDPELLALAGTVRDQALSSYDPATETLAHTCGTIDEDVRETRFDLELQDTLNFSDSLRLVSGLGYRYDNAKSETYLGGSEERHIGRLFGQLEWHMTPNWLLQGGSMLEVDSSAGTSLTPRLALNYLINPAHGLRAVYSEAIRTPDMFENDARWQYRARALSPAPFGMGTANLYTHASGSGDLEQEHMRSREIGYNGHFASLGLAVDFKLFHDELTSLISGPLRLEAFNASNDDYLRLRGAETEVDWRLSATDRLRLGWAHTRAEASNPLDEILTPRDSGSAAWLHEWNSRWSSSLIYLGADSLNGYRFERADLRIARVLQFAGNRMEVAGQLQQRLDDEPTGWSNNRYDSRTAFWLTLEADF